MHSASKNSGSPQSDWLNHWFGWHQGNLSNGDLPQLIHFVDGEKGGVGKTMFARCLLQWFIDHNLSIWGIEADNSNLDLLGYYGDESVHPVLLTENEKMSLKTDALFQFALERTLVVDLPSRAYRPLSHWLEKSGVVETGRESGIGLVRWFVSNGGHASIQAFYQNLETWGDRIPHVLVRNLYMRDDWSSLEEQSEWQERLQEYRVLVIDLPQLHYDERDLIDSKRLTFGEAIGGNDLFILQKQRVRRFLSSVYEQIEGTGLCTVPSDPSTSAKE